MEYYKNNILRRKTRKIMVGDIGVGSSCPITIQSMTNTLTSNTEATIEQINQIKDAGADIVRVSCPDKDSTESLKKIIQKVSIPIVADIHFHHLRAIEAAEAGAACIRINPGNIGKEERIKDVIDAAKLNSCSMRIGVNAGSLEKDIIKKFYRATPEAMLESALKHINILEKFKFYETKISVKASNVALAVGAYRMLAKSTDYPLHLGITEAGSFFSGTIKSSLGIGLLLNEGIGDTIRVSLSDDPVKEVKVGIEILKALGIRKSGVTIISCPSCARQQFDVINTVREIERRFSHVNKALNVSILGCVVNGPGEAKESDIGLTGGGKNKHQIYLNGKKSCVIDGENLVENISKLIEKQLKLNEKN